MFHYFETGLTCRFCVRVCDSVNSSPRNSNGRCRRCDQLSKCCIECRVPGNQGIERLGRVVETGTRVALRVTAQCVRTCIYQYVRRETLERLTTIVGVTGTLDAGVTVLFEVGPVVLSSKTAWALREDFKDMARSTLRSGKMFEKKQHVVTLIL